MKTVIKKCPVQFKYNGQIYDCVGNDEGQYWAEKDGESVGFEQGNCEIIFTEEELTEIGKEIARLIYPNGDNFHCRQTNSGKWELGYTNDYPMQHGDGEKCIIPLSLLMLAKNSL